MDLHKLALFTHILGVILWIGGTITAAVASLAALTDREEGADREGSSGEAGKGAPLAAALRSASRAINVVAHPGSALAWIGGLAMLLPNFSAIYARAGWMHGKLTVALLATAITGILGARVRKASTGQKPLSRGLVGGLGLAAAFAALLVLFLVIFRPGA